MQYEVTREKGQAAFEITVTPAEWEEEINAAYKKNAKKFNIQGFRKGQAPRKIIERYYGESVFFDDAFDECVRHAYIQALQENEDIIPVDNPKTDVKSFPDGSDKPLQFSLTVTTRPEVVLGAYTGMKVQKVEYTVKTEDVDAELKKVRERAARKVTVTDRPVQNGDTVKLDYSGAVDGVKFDGGTAEGQSLKIGAGQFIPGFEEQMIGMNAGGEKDLTVQFPDDYHSEELKGKTAVFSVKVHEITFDELPELNDEFARDRSKFETLSEYRADIEARLRKENASRADNENRSKMLDAVVEGVTVEIPDCMADDELEYMLEDMGMRLKYMYGGMKLEDYFKYTGGSVEDYKKEHATEAKNGVKTRLVLQALIKKENIDVTDEELDAEIKKTMPEGKDFDVYKETVEQEQLSRMKNEIVLNKLFDFLFRNNTMEVTDGTAAETKNEKRKTKNDGEAAKPAPAKKKAAAKQ